jgi:hypothetical protein
VEKKSTVGKDKKVFTMARWSIWVKFATVLPILVFLYLLGELILLPTHFGRTLHPMDFAATGIVGGALLLVYVFAPRRYIVDTEQLVIKRAVWSISIPYKNILAVVATDNAGILWWVLSMGNNGFAGYWGVFPGVGEGEMKWVRVYATDLKRMVRIKTTVGKTYYLSPADPEGFVAALKERLH